MYNKFGEDMVKFKLRRDFVTDVNPTEPLPRRKGLGGLSHFGTWLEIYCPFLSMTPGLMLIEAGE